MFPFECLTLSCFCQQKRIFQVFTLLFTCFPMKVLWFFCGVADTTMQGLFSYYFLITFSLDADLQSWTERVENFSYNKTSSDGIYPLPTPPWPMVVSGEERRSIQHCFPGWGGKFYFFSFDMCVFSWNFRNYFVLDCRWEGYPKYNLSQNNS